MFERIAGADHALDLPSQQVPENLKGVFGRVVDWFLGEVKKWDYRAGAAKIEEPQRAGRRKPPPPRFDGVRSTAAALTANSGAGASVRAATRAAKLVFSIRRYPDIVNDCPYCSGVGLLRRFKRAPHLNWS